MEIQQEQTSKEVGQKAYQQLLFEISKIYEDTKDSTLISMNKIRNHAFWLIGQRIAKAESEHTVLSGKKVDLVENLSRDLSLKYAQGFARDNISSMRKLYLTHTQSEPNGSLSWAHLQLLLKVKNEADRKQYEWLALERQLSLRDLRKVLIDGKVDVENGAIPQPKKKQKIKGKFEYHRGSLYCYPIMNKAIGENKQQRFCLDCGFHCYKELSLRDIANPQVGEIVECFKDNDAFNIKRTTESRGGNYTYKAIIARYEENNKLIIDIDLGFDHWLNKMVTLHGVKMPSLKTKKGQQAAKCIKEIVTKSPVVVVNTFNESKDGTYLVDLFYLPGETNAHIIAQKGNCLNQELLDTKLAVIK